ncbi:MAG: hypothetical protein WCD80_07200 [Desulfobaccales bacterium]
MARIKKKTTVEPGGQEPGNGPSKPQDQEPLPKQEENISFGAIINAVFTSFGPDAPENSDKIRDDLIKQFLNQELNINPTSRSYNVLIFFDMGVMVKTDADNIYSAAAKFREKKPLLLILYSTGGDIGSAYLIGKLCREYSTGKFVIVVPREAKSSATLLCCAADEIHMGSLSELGPIDPQINKLPALGLKSSIEHIASLIKDYPQASEMFAKYLNLSLNPHSLGYYERVAESASQYAERLLKTHSKNLKQDPKQIANALVYSYKDHGFVIDKTEALEIFGDKIIKKDTDEYGLGNHMYGKLMLISRIASLVGQLFYLIGSCDSQPQFIKKPS